MVLNALYEQDFLECSYGFRTKRSAHQDIDELWKITMMPVVSVGLELDIEKCFDVLDPVHMRSFLDQRVRDGVIRKAIDNCADHMRRWLAGIELFEGKMGSIQREDTAFYTKRKSASHRNGT